MAYDAHPQAASLGVALPQVKERMVESSPISCPLAYIRLFERYARTSCTRTHTRWWQYTLTRIIPRSLAEPLSYMTLEGQATADL